MTMLHPLVTNQKELVFLSKEGWNSAEGTFDSSSQQMGYSVAVTGKMPAMVGLNVHLSWCAVSV